MSSDLLSKDKVPFIVGVFFSVVAWTVNGLISEITDRKVVQYSTSRLEEKDASKLIVRVRNLSSKNAIRGAAFRIRPMQDKFLKKYEKGAIGRIFFPGSVDVDTPDIGGSVGGGAQFILPLIPPGAELELWAKFPKGDPKPKFEAFYYLASNSKIEVDADMRIISAGTFEAWLLRNQLIIYSVLLLIALGFIGFWGVQSFRVTGSTAKPNRTRVTGGRAKSGGK